MKNGIIASLNEKIDFETAWLVGSELGFKVKLATAESPEEEENKLKTALDNEKTENLLARPPVIVVMGHVDHGKTKLLDAIRRTHVVEGEAGGITQHIGAYQVERKYQAITFIDTPGHEAFTAMRSRGAKIADIAILVVAADDGVKPQTVEAFRIIKAAKIPFVVAINKIDKPEANIDKTKQELSSQLSIIPEDWGGKTVCAPVSALKTTGISELLDLVLLVAETEAENIKANPASAAIGTIIESHIDRGAGAVATILVQNGTLKCGDALMFNNMNIGKVRGLNNYLGKKIDFAGPATPAQIIGLKTMPQVGDILQVGKGEKGNLKKYKNRGSMGQAASGENGDNKDQPAKKINLIIKSDVLGTAEAIEESLEKINSKEISVKIIHNGLGNISDGDLKRAEATNGIILGFNVKIPPVIEEFAREKNIDIRLYSIIYDLINDIKKEMDKIIEPTIERNLIGSIKVLAIFRTDKEEQIIGGKVFEGRAEPSTSVEVMRNDEFIVDGKITRLQAGKQDINIAEKGEECGLQITAKPMVKEGDIIKIFKEERIIKKSKPL